MILPAGQLPVGAHRTHVWLMRRQAIVGNKKTLSLERLIDLASNEFCLRRYEDVSVSKIAKLAHCSTSTIYEVFSGKGEIFRRAMLSRLERSRPTMPGVAKGEALTGLVEYFESRQRDLDCGDLRKLFAAVVAQRALIGGEFLEELHHHHEAVERIMTRFVELAVEEGTMLTDTPSSVGYLLSASSAYGPTSYGLTFGVDFEVDYGDVLRKTFSAFVTSKGRAALERQIARCAEQLEAA